MRLRTGLLAAALATTATQAPAAVIYYQEGFSNNFWSYDTDTATETLVGDLGLGADSTGLAFNRVTGVLYAFERESESLYTVDTGTGLATLVGVSGIAAEDLTISLDGTTGYATAGGSLYSIDLATGIAISLGSLGTLDGLTTLADDAIIDGIAYAAGSIFGVDSHSFYHVDIAGVSSTFLGSICADETLDFGVDGTLYGHDDAGSLCTISLTDLSTSILAATTPDLVFGMAVDGGITPVPEPGLVGLLGIGVLGLGLARRRRN